MVKKSKIQILGTVFDTKHARLKCALNLESTALGTSAVRHISVSVMPQSTFWSREGKRELSGQDRLGQQRTSDQPPEILNARMRAPNVKQNRNAALI